MLSRLIRSRIKDIKSLYDAAIIVVENDKFTKSQPLQPVTLLLQKKWGEEVLLSPKLANTVNDIITADIETLIPEIKHPYLSYNDPIEKKIKAQQELVAKFETRMEEVEKEEETLRRERNEIGRGNFVASNTGC